MLFRSLEIFQAEEANRSFSADLSHKPKLEDIPRDMADPRWEKAGMLPFRIDDCYKRTLEQIRKSRLTDKPGQFPRDEHATKWAGMLAHYAADNTMPLHATIDYQAYSFFLNLEKSKKPKVHFDMEYVLVDGENEDYPALREELWKHLQAALSQMQRPAISKDVWTTSVGISLQSYDALSLIGNAARAAYLDSAGNLKAFDADVFYHFAGKVNDAETTILQMKARQLALATKWVETLLLTAWQEANNKPNSPK